MQTRTKITITSILLFLLTCTLPAPVLASGYSIIFPEVLDLPSGLPNDKNITKEPVVLQELHIGDLITLPIVQQPEGNLTFVSTWGDSVTEFQAASRFGTVGILAHNYLAGRYFSKIVEGQEITLVYSNGKTGRYIVTEIQQYQALTPESPTSNFINLADGESLTASQVFKRTYGNGPGPLILQTCIYAEQNPSWGRLFIIAQSVERTAALD